MKHILLVSGGFSSEYEVSIKSAQFIKKNLELAGYEVTELTLKKPEDLTTMNLKAFDLAYNTVHGDPGENGKIQAYFELNQLPYVGCNSLVSALTFNKYATKRVLKDLEQSGLNFAKDLYLPMTDEASKDRILAWIKEEQITYPIVIKPNQSGSSMGVHIVKNQSQIQEALNISIDESEDILIEQAIKGVELSIGVYESGGIIKSLPVTEVIPESEFFDYDAKYNGKVEEITPARINQNDNQKLQDLTCKIYQHLCCSGVCRVDWFLVDGNPYFLEINTAPGMASTSFIPQQLESAGINAPEFFDEIIQEII